jgi:hypothetical protein
MIITPSFVIKKTHFINDRKLKNSNALIMQKTIQDEDIEIYKIWVGILSSEESTAGCPVIIFTVHFSLIIEPAFNKHNMSGAYFTGWKSHRRQSPPIKYNSPTVT